MTSAGFAAARSSARRQPARRCRRSSSSSSSSMAAARRRSAAALLPPSNELGPRSRRNSRKASAGGNSAAGISSSRSRAWRRRISPGASPLVATVRGISAGSDGCCHVTPGRRVRHLDLHVVQPGLDVEVEQLRAVREPAFTFGWEGQQHILEPPEGALAVDRDEQPLAQRRVGHRADEAFHPAVLLSRRGRVDAQVALRARWRRAPGGPPRLAHPRRSRAGLRFRGRESSLDPESFARRRSPDHSSSP